MSDIPPTKTRNRVPLFGQMAMTEKIDELRGLLTLLAEALATDEGMRIDCAYLLPLRNSSDEKAEQSIVVQGFNGDELAGEDLVRVRSAVIDALTRIDYHDYQHKKATIRTPGLCAVSDEVIELVKRTNKLRHEISELVIECCEPEKRRTFWKRQKNVCSLQVIRQALILEEPEQIHFYWDDSGSFKRYQAADLLKVLAERFSIDPTLATEEWVVALRNLPPNEHVAVKREGFAHVRARIKAKFHREEVRDGKTEMVEVPSLISGASVPFLYSKNSDRPVIVHLDDNTDESKEARNSKGECTDRQKLERKPHVENLKIYRYQANRKGIRPSGNLESKNQRNSIRTSREK